MEKQLQRWHLHRFHRAGTLQEKPRLVKAGAASSRFYLNGNRKKLII
jgi:hypothetical protein